MSQSQLANNIISVSGVRRHVDFQNLMNDGTDRTQKSWVPMQND